MPRIVWLASYPKSGNTWLRVFLANYGRDVPEPADIDALDDGPVASDRSLFDGVLGIDSSRLGAAEIEALRPDAYRAVARDPARPAYMKIHDACTRLPDGRPLLPPEASRGAVYVVRNPLDVAVAGAPFIARDLDLVVSIMGREGFVMCPVLEGEPPQPQLPQRLLSWSSHVESWATCTDFPVHVVRYEDMSLEPEAAFGGIVRFLGLPFDSVRLRRAIAHSRFEVLRGQEARHGFRERPPEMRGYFFRRGEVGSWRQELGPDQAARLVARHRVVMQRFGYLDEDDPSR